MNPKISLFASSIRPQLWDSFFRSLKGTTIDYEVVFAGDCNKRLAGELQPNLMSIIPNISDIFKYIDTANIKPAQAYEVARRHCTGDLVHWTCDDAEYNNDILGKAYQFYKENCTRKDIVSIKSRENYDKWYMCDFNSHKLVNHYRHAPKMAPLGLIDREYLNELGGPDRRYICGQWDNDVVMRLYNDGGKLYQFDHPEAYIEIDHKNKHDQEFGTSVKRPFGQGFAHDRKILETAWLKNTVILPGPPFRRFDTGFEPYEDKSLTTKSQSYNIKELFND